MDHVRVFMCVFVSDAQVHLRPHTHTHTHTDVNSKLQQPQNTPSPLPLLLLQHRPFRLAETSS